MYSDGHLMDTVQYYSSMESYGHTDERAEIVQHCTMYMYAAVTGVVLTMVLICLCHSLL